MQLEDQFIHLLFYAFSALLLGAGTMVVLARQPVHSVLYLIVGFFASAGLWMLLEAEFLALILIVVYVGAVMTLFLFVVMMLNLDLAPKRARFVRYLPFAILISVAIAVCLFYAFDFYKVTSPVVTTTATQTSNVEALGNILYTQYFYPFQLAALLLLVAIIAAITLSLRKSRYKMQDISKQLRVNPKERVRLVKIPSAKKS